MTDSLQHMQTMLVKLERTLVAMDWWQDSSSTPSATALASCEPFCVDTLTFSEWLQWVYIPKMRCFILVHGHLPTSSGLLPMGQAVWRDCLEEVAPLLAVLAQLDEIVNAS